MYYTSQEQAMSSSAEAQSIPSSTMALFFPADPRDRVQYLYPFSHQLSSQQTQ